MAVNISQLTSMLQPADPLSGAAGLARLARTNPMHYTADGRTGTVSKADLAGIADGLAGAAGVAGAESPGAQSASSFEDAMLKAMDGVNASQTKSEDAVQQMLVSPDSVDVQDVTIAMAEANMTLNIARTILNRVVTAWKDVINTR
ncbi:MAG TPA: flagellar hook-basal body complex protein FliE [Rectinemataceae bacterium]|nr:flagellar hook-basal body complex protein FliE [Rectinemataceae bacterium]